MFRAHFAHRNMMRNMTSSPIPNPARGERTSGSSILVRMEPPLRDEKPA